MKEFAKGTSDLSQLSIHGNYRAVAAQDVEDVYSRNVARKHIFVSKFAQKAIQDNKSADSIVESPSAFSGDKPPDKTPLDTEFQGLKPADCALAILKRGKRRIS